jgi:hypothetical protein
MLQCWSGREASPSKHPHPRGGRSAPPKAAPWFASARDHQQKMNGQRRRGVSLEPALLPQCPARACQLFGAPKGID